MTAKQSFNMLTVYLGSSGYARPVFRESAEQLGTLIGKSGKSLVYGGMDAGLMGQLALSAMKAGGNVTGIVPQKLKDSERILGGLNQTIIVSELCERKKQMFLMADAVLALPGGFGTLDESLEVLYWGALEMHAKPLVLINIEGYWNPVLPYIRGLKDFDPRYLVVVEHVEEALPALDIWEPLSPVKTPLHFPHFEDEITRDTEEPLLFDRANLENTYMAICALGLKQLGKHQRPIGFWNDGGQFDGLLRWLERAAEEKFITPHCLKSYDYDDDKQALRMRLYNQPYEPLDLHKEKWGEAQQ